MAVLFGDGGFPYLAADLLKWWTGGASASFSIDADAVSGRRRIYATGGNATVVYRSFGANYTQGVVGFRFRKDPVDTFASRTIVCILDGTTEQISIRTNASSVLTVNRGATVLATGSTVLTAGVDNYIELKFTIHASAGVVELHLNGATEIASMSLLNTRGTANTQWNGIQLLLFNVLTNKGWFSDIYALDTAAGSPADFLGPGRFYVLRPAGAGNHADFTPNGAANFGSVNGECEDGDLSFNQSSTTDVIDSFRFDDIPIASGAIGFAQHMIVAKKDAGAARTLAALQRDSSTDRVRGSVALSTSYQGLAVYEGVNPADSAAWEVADLTGGTTEFGYKLTA